MRSSLLAAAFVVALTGAASAQNFQSFEVIERGRYLAVLADCAACHTAPGGQPFAGGLALLTPFGKLVAPNITPDRETGIGDWTDDEFVAAMHDGRGRGGIRLYPAMPYPAYTKMTRDDVLAIRAYLATVEPVSNAVDVNQLPFPFNIRFSLVFWNWLNFTGGRYQPVAQKSAEWNRGAYIVQGAGHCGTCHTPKTLLGGDKIGRPFAGATLQGWFAPDITTDPRKGIGGWSKDDIAQYLKSGANAGSGGVAARSWSSLRSLARSQPFCTKVSLPSGLTSVSVACRSTFGVEERTQACTAPAPMTVVLPLSGPVR